MGKKYGWTEGAGLGKREQGRKIAAKVAMKMDTTGLGAKPGEEMANPWWAKAFNKHCKRVRRRNNDSECSDVSSDSDSSDSDDALFKACGGRTAHRAAKFGLGLGGKLARLEA